MIEFLKKLFKPKPTVVEVEPEAPLSVPVERKYSKATHKVYHEVLYQSDKKGRRAIIRFYPYAGGKSEEVVVEDSNQETLVKKVDRLVDQRMSKAKK